MGKPSVWSFRICLPFSEFLHVLCAPVNLVISCTFHFLIAALVEFCLFGDCTHLRGGTWVNTWVLIYLFLTWKIKDLVFFPFQLWHLWGRSYLQIRLLIWLLLAPSDLAVGTPMVGDGSHSTGHRGKLWAVLVRADIGSQRDPRGGELGPPLLWAVIRAPASLFLVTFNSALKVYWAIQVNAVCRLLAFDVLHSYNNTT